MRKALLLTVVLLLLLSFLPTSSHAAPSPCDTWLYLYGVGKARLDPTPPPLGLQQHWHYVDAPYTADYWSLAGIAGVDYILQIRQGRRVVGYARNWQWMTCADGAGWKNWLRS